MVRNEFDFLAPDEEQKKRMLEKIKAHQKSRRINFSFVKAAVPIAAAAVIVIAVVPFVFGKSDTDGTEILVSEEQYAAAVRAFSVGTEGDYYKPKTDKTLLMVAYSHNEYHTLMIDWNSVVTTTAELGEAVGVVVDSNDDSFIGAIVYETPFSLYEYSSVVEYNGKKYYLKPYSGTEYILE